MKSFGAQWLNDWEDAHEPADDKPVKPDIRWMIVQELRTTLADPLAAKLADSIMLKIDGHLRH